MADEYAEIAENLSSPSGADDSSFVKQLQRKGKIATKGLFESIPLVGQSISERIKGPEPKTETERFLKRGASLAPYAIPGIMASPIVGTSSLILSTAGGEAAERLGGGPWSQAGAEMLGGGIPGVMRQVAGKTLGYIEPELESLSKLAKKEGYEIGPGARTRQGMSYGAGEDAEQASRNLKKATQEATARAGNVSDVIDAEWSKKTGTQLQNEVNGLFAGKRFNTDVSDVSNIQKIFNDSKSAFGDQYNIVESIITDNIAGARPGGKIVGTGVTQLQPSVFDAEGLRKAIIQINYRLGTGENPVQNTLLYDLKDALDSIAEKNLSKQGGKKLADKYVDWKRKYHAYATINDVLERGGVDEAKKINLPKLKQIILNRQGSRNAGSHPLHDRLAEYADVIRSYTGGQKGVVKAVSEIPGETTAGKAIKSALQPRVGERYDELRRALGTFAGPLATQTQLTPSGKNDPYSGIAE